MYSISEFLLDKKFSTITNEMMIKNTAEHEYQRRNKYFGTNEYKCPQETSKSADIIEFRLNLSNDSNNIKYILFLRI